MSGLIGRFIERFHIRPWSARKCERVMRRMTDGVRGCANPSEHLLA